MFEDDYGTWTGSLRLRTGYKAVGGSNAAASKPGNETMERMRMMIQGPSAKAEVR
jgi:type IV secretory pathway VirB2 component (pilin)